MVEFLNTLLYARLIRNYLSIILKMVKTITLRIQKGQKEGQVDKGACNQAKYLRWMAGPMW